MGSKQELVNSVSSASVSVGDYGNVVLHPTRNGALQVYDVAGVLQATLAPGSATYVTLTANNTLTQEAVLGTAVVMAGTALARPANGAAGRLYFATDTFILYRDSGTAWVQIVSTALPTIRVTKASDEARNTTTSLTADTNLLFAVAANENWGATFFISYESAANADFKMDFTIPSGATASYVVAGLDASDAAEVVSGANTTVTTLGGAGATTERDVAVTVRVSNGATPGNVVLRWAQAVSQGTSTTVMAGSYLVANRLA